jgi:hypothetical protein
MVITRVQKLLQRTATHTISNRAPDVSCLVIPSVPETETLYSSYTDPSSGTPIDFFQLNVSKFQAQTYPDLGATNLVGYNGMFPGPTFRIQRGRQSVIRVVNQNGDMQRLERTSISG